MKIDGKQIAQVILEELKIRVKKLKQKNIIPNLAIILIGNDPASEIYVKQKKLIAEKIGIKTSLFQYTDSIPIRDLLKRLNDLNHLSEVHGIIVQQPLPLRINLKKITEAIDPRKDVDGFHANSKFQMPIALAILEILKRIHALTPGVTPKKFGDWLKILQIVILGKGETGGRPIIESLKKNGINPFIIDSKTPNPKNLTKNADIIISAVGKPNVVTSSMIKKGAILISIGLHKGTDGKLHGDYNKEEIKNKASFYTPTPGGVGPVNVAMLLKNLVISAGS